MVNPEQKFKIGDRVYDNFSEKEGVVSAIFWSEGDADNKAEWSYSIDKMGWLFIGESDLTLLQSGLELWDAVKELTKGVEVDLDAPLEDDE